MPQGKIRLSIVTAAALCFAPIGLPGPGVAYASDSASATAVAQPPGDPLQCLRIAREACKFWQALGYPSQLDCVTDRLAQCQAGS